MKQEIKKRYGVRATVSVGEFPLKDTAQRSELFTEEIASLYLQYKALEGLQSVLLAYPPELIAKHVEEIRVGNEVRMKNILRDEPVGGTVDYNKKLVAVSLIPLVSTHLALLGNSPDHRTVHHEIAHLIGGKIPRAEWEALHPGVEYDPYLSRALIDKDGPPGFTRGYGMTSYGEDIATVAEVMFTPHAGSYGKLTEDAILKRKFEYLKKWYEKESNGLMNDRYWRDLATGGISEDYWNDKEPHRPVVGPR